MSDTSHGRLARYARCHAEKSSTNVLPERDEVPSGCTRSLLSKSDLVCAICVAF